LRRVSAARRRVGGLVAVVAVAWGVAAIAPPAQAGRGGSELPRGLYVIPFPGTPDASPASQVIFSALSPSQLRRVEVRGSHSGWHAGHLVRLPDGAGTAFVPDRAFASGELVRVRATLGSPAAGTAAGDPGATRLAFSFGVARPAPGHRAAVRAAGRGAVGADRAGAGAGTTAARHRHPATRSFRSQPRLHPPPVSATRDPDTKSGDIFLTPKHSFQSGPMILDSRGRLLWFRPARRGVYASNLQLQSYRGRQVLTWWQGHADVIMGRSYRRIATLHAGYGYSADLHEFQLTRQGTALIDAVVPVRDNLTSVGGPANGTVDDCVIQELDVRTGRVLWEWHSLGHIPISDSYTRPQGSVPYSYFHLNSIQQLPDGNLLVSARNTWAVYKISRRTGRVIWSVGGKHSSFRLSHRARFEWQHDARLVGSTLTVFDDAASPQEEGQSSAKVLKLNHRRRRALLRRRYRHSPPLLALRAGSVQILPNHNVFVGWGNASRFSEYTAAGRQIFNGSLPIGIYSYRAYRFPWTGHPFTRPKLSIALRRHRTVRVYVSWNGATQVATWRVLAGSAPGSLSPLSTHPWTDFETAITLHDPPRYLVVQALNAASHVLRATKVHRT
jgi:hypothetical protein